MTLPIGELVGILSLKGAAEFDAGIMGAQRSLNLAGESATKFGASTDRASGSQAKLRASMLSAIAATERYNTAIAEGGASTAQLASKEAAMIRANERLAASFTQVAASQRTAATESYMFATKSNSGMAGAVGTAKSLGLAFGGIALAMKAISAGKDAAEFQRQMLLIQTNANASAAEVKDLTDAVLKLSPEVGVGPTALAQALYHIEQNGHGLISTAQAMEALKIGAEGAQIGMADVEDTTNTLTIAMASGVKGVDNMRRTMGFMIAAAGTGDMRLSQLNEAIGTGILSIAKGFMPANDVLRDTAAILATLGDNGIRGAAAMQAYRQTMMGFAQPVAKGAEALQSVGLSMTDLRDAMQNRGIVAAMNDLEQHMQAAGVTGRKSGAFITEAFGRRAGSGIAVLMGEINRLNEKMKQGEAGAATMAQKWDATTKTVGFAFDKLSAQAEVVGIQLAQKAGPAAVGLAHVLAEVLPAALNIVEGAMHPFATGWHDLAAILGPVAHGAGDVGHALGPLAPIVKDVGSAVLAMWLAFKGYQLATAAVDAVQMRAVTMATNVRNSFVGMRGEIGATSAQLSTQAAVMEADLLAIGAAAQESAATAAEAQLAAMRTYTQVSASEIADMEAVATTARASAVQTAAAAEEASAAVAAAGDSAKIGWASLAGPLGLAAVGVLTLVSLFHKSAQASQEATNAAKAYTDALSSGGQAPLIDAITKQLSDNSVPEKIAALNTQLASGLHQVQPAVDALSKSFGGAAFSGKDFLTAVEQGGKPLDQLRAKLQAVIDAGTSGTRGDLKDVLDINGVNQAKTLLADLNAQYDGLSKAQQKEISDAKAFGTTVTPIQNVAKATQVATSQAAQYAAMLGFQVTKNNDVVGSAKQVNAAVDLVSTAYNRATTAVGGLLEAQKTFSTSAGTAADRAALIGATLKAANGDALAFAGAMSGTTTAVDALTGAFKQQRDQLSQQSQQQTQAAERVNVAQKRLNEVRANGKHTASELASAEKSLHDAQAAAAQGGALAYADTERAALRFKQTQDGLKASIVSTATGAGDLVSQLQGIQDAAVGAASAMFQHEKATKGAKQAADDAYAVYISKTKQALIDSRKELGLTLPQAKALAQTYFGMDGQKVKTTIEAEGTDPILTVLNKIGRLLAHLTGQQWNVKVNENVTRSYNNSAAGATTLEEISRLPAGPGSGPIGHRAMGGPVLAGHAYVVGERRPEVFVPSTNGRIEPDAARYANSTAQKLTHIDHFTYAPQINYPAPEPASVSLPRVVRDAAHQLDGFG